VISFPSRVLRVKSGAKPREGCVCSLEQWGRRKSPAIHSPKMKIVVRKDGFISNGKSPNVKIPAVVPRGVDFGI
jgi:hypothetical protein